MKKQKKINSRSHKLLEDFRTLSDQILNYVNQGIPRVDFLSTILKMLRDFSGCNTVELRLKEGSKYYLCKITDVTKPYFHIKNIPCLQNEDGKLIPCTQDDSMLEQMCKDVYLGHFNPSLPFFTKKGSLWTGNIEALLTSRSEGVRQTYDVDSAICGDFKSLILIPLVVGNESIGLLQLKSKRKNYFRENEIEFYEDIAQTLGGALMNQRAQAALQERVKELNCLYGLSKLTVHPNISLERIFQETIDLIPPAWQYPEITCARILFEGQEFKTYNFKKTKWKQRADIKINGKKAGSCEVYYLKEKPEIDEGPFLKEERALLNTIVAMLESIAEAKHADKALRESEHALRERVKELSCLYGIDEISRKEGITIEEVLKKAIQLIPPSWQYPEITEGCITFEDKKYTTKNFKKTKWMQKANIIVNNKKAGLVEVCYLEEKPESDEGPFLKEERDLINAVSERLGQFITRKRTEEELKQQTHNLGERVKELTCLYSLAKLAERPGISLEEILQGIVNLIPPAWQYPEITFSRIILDGRSYLSPRFQKGKQKQSADIVANGKRRGVIEVIYAKEMPEIDEGPFLKEERSLIDAIAKQVGLIIERRQAEEEKSRLQNQLRHADRLATIGQLAAGVAHEINEPLGNILGFAQLAKKSPGLSNQVEHDIEKIITASLYAREVIKKLMLFARQTPPKKTQVNLNQIVEEGLCFFESRIAKEGIKLERLLSPDLPEVTADPALLTQVLVNLVVNSLQAMPEGGKLTIETAACEDHVLLIVEDTGIGMSKEVMQQIFLPFFTTKKIGQGTGLGLAVVHGIVTSHGGTIKVDSKAGRGTRFEIKLSIAGRRVLEQEE